MMFILPVQLLNAGLVMVLLEHYKQTNVRNAGVKVAHRNVKKMNVHNYHAITLYPSKTNAAGCAQVKLFCRKYYSDISSSGAEWLCKDHGCV